MFFCFFFFFKQKTAYEISSRDWSSDVCSSDLLVPRGRDLDGNEAAERKGDDRGRRARAEREEGGRAGGQNEGGGRGCDPGSVAGEQLRRKVGRGKSRCLR